MLPPNVPESLGKLFASNLSCPEALEKQALCMLKSCLNHELGYLNPPMSKATSAKFKIPESNHLSCLKN